MTESGATEAAPVVGRFAPSPTGRMHAGNIYAALISWLVAKSQGGLMVLRIEDLDRERSKAAYIDQIQRDFEALGLFWDEGPYFQHDRDEAYAEAFARLEAQGLLYPCFCTRADLHAASAPHRGEKLVYAAICRPRRWRRAGQRGARRAGELPWTAARSPSKTSFREPTRKSSTATAATSSYAAPTVRSPTSWQWWWTMPPRASIQSCAASICFAPRRSSATSRIFSGCHTPPMRTFRCSWPSRIGASRNAIGTRP